MKYYAVTDDPNELMHYGVLGMKWGVIRDRSKNKIAKRGTKKRSAAYKKASAKLSSSMQNGIKKVEAHWKEYNSPENKQIRAAKKYERQTNKALEQARRGKLKYGKLDDYQVQRITERLNMERMARQLSNTEKSKLQRFMGALGEGMLQGATQGTARRVAEWASRGSVLKTDRLRAEQQNAFDRERMKRQEALDIRRENRQFENQKKMDEYRNSDEYIRKDAQAAANKSYYEQAINRGYMPGGKKMNKLTADDKGRMLKLWKAEEDQNRLNNIRSEAYYKTAGTQSAKRDYPDSNKNTGNTVGTPVQSRIIPARSPSRLSGSHQRTRSRRNGRR